MAQSEESMDLFRKNVEFLNFVGIQTKPKMTKLFRLAICCFIHRDGLLLSFFHGFERWPAQAEFFFPSKEAVAWTGRHSSQTKNRMAFGLVWWLDIVKWRDPHRKSSRGSSHCEQLQWSVDLKLLCTSPNNCILFFFQWSFPGNTIDCSNIRFNQLEVDFTITSPFRQWIFT